MGAKKLHPEQNKKGSPYPTPTIDVSKQMVAERMVNYSDKSPETQAALDILSHYEALFKSPGAKLTAIKKGLEPQAITDLLELTGATQLAVATILDLTEPTLRKHIKAGKELNTGLSEHILQLFELFDKGMDTFGSLQEFKNWLPQHNIGINAKPMELLDTITGINIILNQLLRIDYGVLA